MTTISPSIPIKKKRAAKAMPFDVTTTQTALEGAIATVMPAADKKSAMPSLACVKLTAREGVVDVEATDLYLAIRSTIDSDVASPGSVVVPASDLLARVKSMPAGPLRLTADDDHRLTLTSIGNARRFELSGMAGAEFPNMPAPGATPQTMHIAVGALRTLIDYTRYAISADMTRAHLNSALLTSDGKVVTMAATDGHRLSVAMTSADIGDTSAGTKMLIQSKSVAALRRIIEPVESDFDLPICVDGPWMFVDWDGTRLASKLVDAKFPPYENVIPAPSSFVVKVERVGLADALKAMALSSDGHDCVCLALAKGVLRVTARTTEGDSGLDELAVEYDCAEAKSSLNARYLLDVLTALDCDVVSLDFGGSGAGLEPIVIRQSAAPASFVGVVMPMRSRSA